MNLRHAIVLTTLTALPLSLTGCQWFSPSTRLKHETTLSYLPYRSALKPQEALPVTAQPYYYGHHATCWRRWPEDWQGCPPCEMQKYPGEYVVPPESIEAPTTGGEVLPQGIEGSGAGGSAGTVPNELAPNEAGSRIPFRRGPSSLQPGTSPAGDGNEPAPMPPIGVDPPAAIPPADDVLPRDLLPPQSSRIRRKSPGGFSEVQTVSIIAAPQVARPEAADDELANQVTQRLEVRRDIGQLADFEIELQVAKGTVVLRGTVTNQQQERQAIELVETTPGVRHVVNELTIKPAAPAKKKSAESSASRRYGRY